MADMHNYRRGGDKQLRSTKFDRYTGPYFGDLIGIGVAQERRGDMTVAKGAYPQSGGVPFPAVVYGERDPQKSHVAFR